MYLCVEVVILLHVSRLLDRPVGLQQLPFPQPQLCQVHQRARLRIEGSFRAHRIQQSMLVESSQTAVVISVQPGVIISEQNSSLEGRPACVMARP